MKHKLTIAVVGGVHVISDNGLIARLFQIHPNTPWEMAVESPAQIGEHVRRMEELIDRAEKRMIRGLIPVPASESGATTTSGYPHSTVTSSECSARVSLGTPEPPPPDARLSEFWRPIESLPIKSCYTWRLKKAGIKTINQLAGMTKRQLSETPGIGPAVVKQAERGMTKLGIRFAKKVSADQKKPKRE